MNTPKLPPLPQLFRDAMDWGRSYGTRLNNTPEMLDEVASQFADKAIAAIEAQGVPDGWQLVATQRLVNARNLVDRGFWVEGAKVLDELIASAPPAPQSAVCNKCGLGPLPDGFGRAIESAACAERDARIAELERQLAEARNQALEDAAKVCDAYINATHPKHAAKEIRAMKEQT